VRLLPLALALGCAPERDAADYACTSGIEAIDLPQGALVQGLLDAAVADGLPGVSLVMRFNDGTSWAASSGYADLDAGAALSSCTPMRVGAVSQMMASAAALSLVQDGELGLDDPLSGLVDDEAVLAVPNADTVTLRQLLSHTSGIPDYLKGRRCELHLLNAPEVPISAEEAVDCAADQEAAFAPGEGFSFSGTDDVLIGLALTAVTDQEPAEILASRVATPMGLSSVTLDPDGEAPTGTARGYGDISGQGDVYDVSDLRLGYGLLDTGVVASTEDMASFAQTLLVGDYLDQAWLHEMKLETIIDGDGKNYGLGLVVDRSSPWGKVFGHAGYLLGYQGQVWYLPDQKVTVALTINGDMGVLLSRGKQLADDELAPLLLELAATGS